MLFTIQAITTPLSFQNILKHFNYYHIVIIIIIIYYIQLVPRVDIDNAAKFMCCECIEFAGSH